MKKLFLSSLLIVLMFALSPAQSKAESRPSVVATNPSEAERVNALLNKVYELRATDKSTLTRSERKTLRKELRTAKAQMQEGSRHYGGIYLSGGAIIIIILLIILL